MEDVKEERFKTFLVSAHLLEIEAWKTRKGNGVLGIVGEKAKLSAAHPPGQRVGGLKGQRVRQHVEGPQCRIE